MIKRFAPWFGFVRLDTLFSEMPAAPFTTPSVKASNRRFPAPGAVAVME